MIERTMDRENILHKYLNGTASQEEIEFLKESPDYTAKLTIADATSKLVPPSAPSESNYDLLRAKKEKQVAVRKMRPFDVVFKVAAILAVIIAGYLYFDSRDSLISTQIAEKTSITLPDDSEVVLNSGSHIRYSKNNWENERIIELEGEAFFKVSKGNKFTVNTPQGEVSVLGTEFNVFSRQNTFFVNCYEGLVSVATKDTIIQLPAGSQLKFENGRLLEHADSSDSMASWIENESSFNNAQLSFVLNELERHYPIKLTANISNANIQFTGSFTHNELEVALRSICDPLQLAFTIEEESVTIYDKKSQ